MDVAKHTDLLGLLPSLGYTLKRIGSYYTTAEMDSIRIRDPTRWKRYSTGQGGDAIAVKGAIFDDLTLADWEAAKLGTIEAPFTAESYEILNS